MQVCYSNGSPGKDRPVLGPCHENITEVVTHADACLEVVQQVCQASCC